ncbi:MAG TPA: diguanylate cyclase [Thermoanaerobaculia bacterium]|nr:diguanylate cyclase [Thermoanaerobaculia bacterium]
MSARTVLVVDDSEVTRAILSRTLRGAGFDVIEAKDGLEGAVLALRERPAVVVTDLEMPTMDGFPFLRLLKSEPTSAHIPVLILTSHGEAASRFWSLRTGADAYLTKDHHAPELVATIERLMASAAPAPALLPAESVGPLDILARVARQLDASLLQATLINDLLERGMAAGDFHDASHAALLSLAEVIDARFLAVAVGESEGTTLHVLLPEPLAQTDLARVCTLLEAQVEPAPGVPLDFEVSGETPVPVTAVAAAVAAPLDLGRTVFLPLAVRGARAVLAIHPRDPQQFAAAGSSLVGGLTGHLALVLDNARLAQRLHELSTHDGLTRQLNHRATYDRLSQELERARRHQHPLSVILCDFDDFKRVNDTHGHLGGDAVLREGAAALRRCLRAGDLLGRYGGEEFLAVLPEVDLEGGRQAAERLRRCLAEHAVVLAGEEVRITASFGVAEISEVPGDATAADTTDLLVSLADHRLYEAKAAGRNRVRP